MNTNTKLIEYLKNYQLWRRGAETEHPDPIELGQQIDRAINVIENIDNQMENKKTPKVGRFVMIEQEVYIVTEECEILESFFATNSDGHEEEFHISQIDWVS